MKKANLDKGVAKDMGSKKADHRAATKDILSCDKVIDCASDGPGDAYNKSFKKGKANARFNPGK